MHESLNFGLAFITSNANAMHYFDTVFFEVVLEDKYMRIGCCVLGPPSFIV